jgi:fructokinase
VKIISTGEVLWDVFEHREILGGAPLNFSASLQRLGHSVSLVTGVGTDQRGDDILRRMSELCLSTEFVQRIPGVDTGIARVTLDAGGSASFVIPRPAAFDSLNIDDQLYSRIAALHGDWIYFGTLSNVSQSNFDLLNEILSDTPTIKGFYDMNLREGHWQLALVEQLSHLATVLKLNDVESEILFHLLYPTERYSLEEFCRRWAARFDIETICVTLGSQGCAVFAAFRSQTPSARVMPSPLASSTVSPNPGRSNRRPASRMPSALWSPAAPARPPNGPSKTSNRSSRRTTHPSPHPE